MKTEGIKYNGSKDKIIPVILDKIKNLNINNVLDGFSGTTRVSQAFKKAGFSVDSNDISVYSYIFGKCYLENNKPKTFYKEKIDYLNSLKGEDGWFTENYGGIVTNSKIGNAVQADGKKRIWQKHNTQKLDSIRNEIDNISENEIEKSVLLTSLILAMDKVDSSLGHQVSYLKDWSARSFNKMELLIPELIVSDKIYHSLKGDVINNKNYYDFIYLDPPYGTNNIKMPTTRVRYHSYYHLWTTLILNDKPMVKGAANRRLDASSDTIPGAISAYENTNYQFVFNQIDNLIKTLNFRYLGFSYSSKSKISFDDLMIIFNKYKIIDIVIFPYKENVMKNMTSTNEWDFDKTQNNEFLFIIEK